VSAHASSGAGQQHPLWPMAAVTRRTGIGHHTLRAWERRFGFPLPLRLASGHRRYTDGQIERLTLIKRALAQGHRASDVVPLSVANLEALLGFERSEPGWAAQVIRKTQAFDREGIVSDLAHAYASLGVRTFLRERLVPLTAEMGTAWAEGRLDIKHEHFLSEILEDTLRTLRTPLEHGAQGRPVLLATLPEEQHTLGLQMAALTAALSGRRLRILGVRTPAEEILAAALALDPAAVGISVTPYSASPDAVRALNELRAHLPAGIALWVGGAGAALLNGLEPSVLPLSSLDDLEVELRRLARHDSERS